MMNRITLLVVVVLGFGAMIAGCGSGTSAVRATSETLADSLLMRLRASYETTPTLAINGEMKIAGMGITIWYDALVKSRDSLRVNLIGPFGVPVGALAATRGAFVFFNAQEGEAIEGKPDGETFSKLMQLELDYDQMVAMFRGELPRFPERGTYEYATNSDGVRYTVRSAIGREQFVIDPADATVLSYVRYPAVGDTTTEDFAITYKDFRTVGGRKFPHRASVSIANGDRKVSITVDKARESAPEGKYCTVQLPAGVPRRRM